MITQVRVACSATYSTSPGITLESLKHGVRLDGDARPVGIITLEDIIEEIIQEVIMHCSYIISILAYTLDQLLYDTFGDISILDLY